MPSIDLADDTFVAVDRAVLVTEVRDPARWRRWWPELELDPVQDRGPAGVRWAVRGALVGSGEIWLEPVADGVVLHLYLRVEPADGPLDLGTPRGRRRAERIRDRYARAWKRQVWELADRLAARPAPRRSGTGSPAD